MKKAKKDNPVNTRNLAFVEWFRSATPYINSFRGKTFVVAFGGEVVQNGTFVNLTHDFNLLASLGARLVLVHGARAQIEARLAERGAKTRYVKGLRVTDATALQCVKEAVGRLRAEIEATLSMGLPNSPMAGADIRVACGNFITAKPLGVIDGVDFQHTGEVRKIDAHAMRQRLDAGELVLLSPLGYSPTGETFNLALEDVAAGAAIALNADKLVFLMATEGVQDTKGRLLRELSAAQAEAALKNRKIPPEDVALYLPRAIAALRAGVDRVHLISRHIEGALLIELFTHQGSGTMVTRDPVQNLRRAGIEDVGGILELIRPLESEGSLVKRGRERLETEIDRFWVLEHDGVIAGCAALYPVADKAGELACLAVHRNFRNSGFGDALLTQVENEARKRGMRELFVLTTRTAHWFVERAFRECGLERLPEQRQSFYNYQRRSKVLLKKI